MNAYIQNGLAALGDGTRLAIFMRVARRPVAVGEIAARMTVSRPAVSQHLRVLKRAKLVRDRHAGTRRIYELNPEGVVALRDHFSRLWELSLGNFKSEAELLYQQKRRELK